MSNQLEQTGRVVNAQPSRRSTTLITLVSVMLGAFITFPAPADETDQFTLPPRESFVDLGDYLSHVHYRVLKRVVDRTNRDILKARRLGNKRTRAAQIQWLQSPEILADRVRHEFGQGFVEMRLLEEVLYAHSTREVFPNRILAYKTPTWIYFHTHLPFDPRKLVLLFQASTIKAYGVYFGTDKFGHFHDLGHIYFKDYRAALKRGLTEEEAVESVVRFFSRGPISEAAIIGFLATGVHSNADLATNYIGMKFYRNLTQPAVLHGEERPPMVVRIGEFWALNLHVRPDSGFMRPFFSDHWNEALNPSVYEWGMRGPIASRIRAMSERILAFYAHEDGTRRTRAEFEFVHAELQTYFGENYGYMGEPDQLVTIANTLFGEEEPPAVEDDEVRNLTPDASAPKSGAPDSSSSSAAQPRSSPPPQYFEAGALGARGAPVQEPT